MEWAWKLRKGAISTFVAVHIFATLIWVVPDCPIKAACFSTVGYYMFPTGLWQFWGMFAPEPIKQTVTLEAEVVDAQGLRHIHVFPKVEGSSVWQSFLKGRHPKFAANLALRDLETTRVYTTRYAVRQLHLPDSAFPLDAYLVHKMKPAPPLGEAVGDSLVETTIGVLHVSHFDKASEVQR